jgi:hypothetical protein
MSQDCLKSGKEKEENAKTHADRVKDKSEMSESSVEDDASPVQAKSPKREKSSLDSTLRQAEQSDPTSLDKTYTIPGTTKDKGGVPFRKREQKLWQKTAEKKESSSVQEISKIRVDE